MSDRYVIYQAVGRHPVAGGEPTTEGLTLRIRTYGGPIPPKLDAQYRHQLIETIEEAGGECVEIAVADLAYIDGLPYEPVHGFVDARDVAHKEKIEA